MITKRSMGRRGWAGGFPAALSVLLCALAGGGALASTAPGFVDAAVFRNIAGEDSVTVEISIGKPLMRLFGGREDELGRLVAGLESVYALILDLSEDPQGPAKLRRAVKAIEDTESRLRRQGWERIALVREREETVRVLVLPKGDLIQGLVVMITGSDEIVFTNIAGVVDLARLEAIAEHFDVPGLDDLELPPPKNGKGKPR